jgi:hypothetical protein
LPLLLYQPDVLNKVSLLMFAADLNVWSLQLHAAGDLLSSWVLDTLANAYPTSFLTKKVGDALRAFRLQLAVALEAALLGVCPALQQELGARWPPYRRQWKSEVAEVGPQASDAIDEIVQTLLHGAHWQEIRSNEATSELQEIAAEVVTNNGKVAKYQQALAEESLGTESAAQSDDYEDFNETAWRLRAGKLVVRALELQYQACKSDNFDARQDSWEVSEILLPITSREDPLFALRDESREESLDMEAALMVVETLCKRGDMQLCAVAAQLGGKSDIANMWLAAADACAEAVMSNKYEELDDLLCGGCKTALERAEVLAEQARRAEEALAESNV